ncbi:MAG TPA: BatA and WFA domain-containing protein [Tepidisphaeraceae bacterium]|jgi:hypothetical protein|nr:BatA and WFA domain-containing protein [Tepidisphaeraceae bacterium]
MFGLDFLFASALFALPIAGLPVLLHLLFRKKSPVVQFSTIRFIRSSMQRTAARRKLQRWLLLACRAFLLLLLIWAIAQPAHRAAANWLGSAKSPIAAIVIDTSYSMLLKDRETPLLDSADAAVQSLLRQQLAGARVAVFRSDVPPADQPETLRESGEWLTDWSPLQPTPAGMPLAERITAATEFLNDQSADQKWLFVLSDFQSREFPRPVTAPGDVRAVFIDLHADDARSAGVTNVTVQPQRPIPGVGSDAVVSIAGRAGESRAVTLRVASPAGDVFSESTLVGTLDRAGRAQLRFPLKLPAERWLTLTASLPAGDASEWDDSRTHLIEVPPRRVVSLLAPSPAPPAERFLRLALDPSEGADSAWPLLVKPAQAIAPDAQVAVAMLSAWPAAERVQQLSRFAQSGGVVIVALQPGLEESWSALSADRQAALADFLGGTPAPRSPTGTFTALAGSGAATVLEGLNDPAMQLASVSAQRFVPLAEVAGDSEVVLSLSRSSGVGSERPLPLLLRQPHGAGAIFSLTTLPDPRFTNLPTHPVFLPTLVRIAVSGTGGSTPANVEIGQPIVLRDRSLDGRPQLNLETPRQERFVLPANRDEGGVSFVFSNTGSPGIHTITTAERAEPVAMANVQLPGAEAEVDRREAATVASGDNVVVVRSVEELQSKFATLSEPEPRWSTPIALVLVLLCFESLMGSVTSAWQWPIWGATRTER